MKHNPNTAYESAMKNLADDIARLRFDGENIVGKNGLVSANVKTRKLEFRRLPADQPFYVADIPSTGRPGSVQAFAKKRVNGFSRAGAHTIASLKHTVRRRKALERLKRKKKLETKRDPKPLRRFPSGR